MCVKVDLCLRQGLTIAQSQAVPELPILLARPLKFGIIRLLRVWQIPAFVLLSIIRMHKSPSVKVEKNLP